ncbi:MAG: phosphate acyltransferase PlsX [Clostridia bacterium]|nr:phosphate acyltransferase PlsX [Clostridia bacterium]
MIRIIVDCFGGDRSPSANVEGSLAALEALPDVSLVLTGDRELIEAELAGKKYDKSRIEVVHAPEVIGCDEKPTDAIRLKKESSMMKAVALLRADEAGEYAGMVSCGSTGALVAASTLRVGRLRGVIRPAFCPVMPTMKGGVVGVCDSGANVDVTPDYLIQNAVMGSLYMKAVYGIESPRVGLLNIGTEAGKGDDLRKETYPLLAARDDINFAGNAEARELLGGDFDLIVCDGFAGNVLIKSTEGACLEMLKKLKKDINSSFINKIGALFMYRMFMKEKEFMNYQNYGGSVLLGTVKTVVKGHGSSNARAVEKCIEQVYRTETGSLNPSIEAALDTGE